MLSMSLYKVSVERICCGWYSATDRVSVSKSDKHVGVIEHGTEFNQVTLDAVQNLLGLSQVDKCQHLHILFDDVGSFRIDDFFQTWLGFGALNDAAILALDFCPDLGRVCQTVRTDISV